MHQATLIMEDLCYFMTIACATSAAINITDLTSANLPGRVELMAARGNIVLSFIPLIISVIVPIRIAIPSKPRGQRKTWKMLLLSYHDLNSLQHA